MDKKFEIECLNPKCKHNFLESLNGKKMDSILTCPKCGFKFPINKLGKNLLLKIIKFSKDEYKSK